MDMTDYEFIQLKQDIKSIRAEVYEHGVRLKVLEDRLTEFMHDIQLLNQQLKLLDMGNKWFRDNKEQKRKDIQANIKGKAI